MKKNKFLARMLGLVIALSMALSACTPAATPPAAEEPEQVQPTSAPEQPDVEPTAVEATTAADVPPAEGKTRIEVWWDISNEKDVEAYQKAFDEFNNSQDKIEAVIVKGQNNDAFTTAVTGNNAPDLYITWDGSEIVGTWAHNEMLAPFDNYITRDSISMDPFVASSVNLGYYNGKYYGMPWQSDTILLFYNKHHFEEAGLDPENPPKTLDELIAAAEKLTQYDENGNITRMGLTPPTWFGPWYTQLAFYRPDMLDEENNKVTLNTPEMTAGIQDIKRIWDIYGDPENADKFMSGLGNGLSPDDPFLTGQVSMVIDGDWRMGYEVRYTDNVYGEDFAAVTVPYPNGKEDFAGASYYFGMLFVMPHNAPHPEEAWEFVKFMNQASTDIMVSEGMWNLPFTKEGLQSPVLHAMPGFSVPLNNVLENEDKMYNLPVFPATVKLSDELAAAIDLIVHNKSEISDALIAAEEAVQSELDAVTE